MARDGPQQTPAGVAAGGVPEPRTQWQAGSSERAGWLPWLPFLRCTSGVARSCRFGCYRTSRRANVIQQKKLLPALVHLTTKGLGGETWITAANVLTCPVTAFCHFITITDNQILPFTFSQPLLPSSSCDETDQPYLSQSDPNLNNVNWKGEKNNQESSANSSRARRGSRRNYQRWGLCCYPFRLITSLCKSSSRIHSSTDATHPKNMDLHILVILILTRRPKVHRDKSNPQKGIKSIQLLFSHWWLLCILCRSFQTSTRTLWCILNESTHFR